MKVSVYRVDHRGGGGLGLRLSSSKAPRPRQLRGRQSLNRHRCPTVRAGPELHPTEKETDKPKVPPTAPVKGPEVPETTQVPEAPQIPAYPLKISRSWAAIAADKFIDSADDILTHLKRSIRELPSTTALQRLRKQGEKLVLKADKPVVLVLGSGWGAHSLIKVIDTDDFEVVCISPSNAFLFTPMLPSTAVGTVEFRSLLEPIRVANEFVTFCEATCDSLDLQTKVASCTSTVADGNGQKRQFDVHYDILVVSVGEQPASFGVPGVTEHCFFMKEIRDAVSLRLRIQQVFELASLPGTPEEDVHRLLHFVVVGGGPTGVEFAGTLADFLRQDLKRKYPELMKYVKVTLLQSAQTILTQFDSKLAARAMANLEKIGIEVRTGVRVTEVTAEDVVLKDGERIPHGVCVWSAGNATRPLVKDLVQAIPQQSLYTTPSGRPSGKLAVDPFLRVIGAKDVIALGDCSMIVGGMLPATAQVAAQQGAYVAHVINRHYRIGTGGEDALPPYKLASNLSLADRVFGSITDSVSGSMSSSIDEDGAQETREIVVLKKPFEFLSLGILASVGDDKAIAQIEAFDNKLAVWGSPAFLLWKSVYITKQVSLRNRVLILFDWLKAQVFGRDLSQF